MNLDATSLKCVLCKNETEWHAAKKYRKTFFFKQQDDPYTWTFTHKNHQHFVLYDDINIVGYAHIQLWPNNRVALRIIAIDQTKQNQGLGREFMRLLEKHLKINEYNSIHIEASPKALPFYLKLGYTHMPFNDPDGYDSGGQDVAVGKTLLTLESKHTEKLTIKNMTENDIDVIVHAFANSNWTEKPKTLFYDYLFEQEQKTRIIWLASWENKFAGYATLMWQSNYPYFEAHGIPEINDLNVLPNFRKKGIGTALLSIAQAKAFEKTDTVGLGVGLYQDYGAAQKCYIKRGYMPDGNGVTYNNRPIKPGEKVMLDDNLLLWLMKKKM